jgi:hypothetical protein
MKGQLRGKMKQIHELINIKELNLPEDNVGIKGTKLQH